MSPEDTNCLCEGTDHEKGDVMRYHKSNNFPPFTFSNREL